MKELNEVIEHLEFVVDIATVDLTEDIEKLKIVKKRLEAIDYAHSSIQLKEKEVPNFYEYLVINKYVKDRDSGLYFKGELPYSKHELSLKYKEDVLNL